MKKEQTVELPVSILEKFLALEEELEDWLMAHDEEFLKRMKKASFFHYRLYCLGYRILDKSDMEFRGDLLLLSVIQVFVIFHRFDTAALCHILSYLDK